MEPAREVRKIVSVLFSDVTGSTSLGERLDPEAVRLVMGRYFDTARTAVERHGGIVEKFIGDAVMAIFGIPLVHEDDALRAVRAGAELQEALRTLDAELEPSGVVLGVRVGIESGEVVAGVSGQGSTLVTGDPVNVAARLEQAAAPGEVLLGAGTLGMLGDAAVVEPLEPLALKGKSSPVPAFRLISVSTRTADRASRVEAPMVGRERELTVLRHAFGRAVVDRTAQLFTVFGTAGVGKSRLVREFRSGVEESASICRGRCLPYGEGITYWPIMEIVRASAGIDDGDSAEVARGRLDRLVGEGPEARLVALRMAQLTGFDPSAAPQEELFWAFRKLLESLALERPLVAIIEDVHWAEPTLLDLIEHVADLARDAPILLLATARPEMLETRPTWGGGRLNATSILLEPLSAAASSALIDELLPGARLPAVARERIAAATEGNPLYVEELVGMLVDDGIIRADAAGGWEVAGDLATVRIPRTIQALLAARLDRLGPAERATAERASVIGRSFERRAVTNLTPEATRSDVGSNLTSLVRKDLIRPEPGGIAEDVFRFRHILIRDAAYESLPKAERADLHERFASWLGTASGDRLSEVEEFVGYHLEQAVRYRIELGLTGAAGSALAHRAATHLGAAASRAVARSDGRAAINLLTRTVALLPLDDPARGRYLIDLGTALADSGDFDRSEEVLLEATRHADAAGDERMKALAVVQRWQNLATHGGHLELARRDTEAARALFEAAGDTYGLVRSSMTLGDIRWWSGQGAAAEAAVLDVIDQAKRAGLDRELADGYANLGACLNTGPTPIFEGIDRCTAILEAELGNRPIEGWMWHALAHLQARLGAFDEARENAARALAILEENGQLYEQANLSEVAADVEVLAGDPAAAARMLEGGLARMTDMGKSNPMLAAFLARAAWLAGDPVRAESAAIDGLEGDTWVEAIARSVLALARASDGRHDDADELSQAAVATFAATDFLNFHGWVMVNRAETLERAGRRAEALAALRVALDLHTRKGSIVEVEAIRRRLAELATAV
jgi:class 3 adenylate cyclase/tetratricopeptide (TPR) repeat protein